jgi:hypothetical protein
MVLSIIQKSMLDNYSSSFFALDHKYEGATLEQITLLRLQKSRKHNFPLPLLIFLIFFSHDDIQWHSRHYFFVTRMATSSYELSIQNINIEKKKQ